MRYQIDANAAQAIQEIIWMARRYADGRKTYAPSMFNNAQKILHFQLGDDILGKPDKVVREWPYATDGQFGIKHEDKLLNYEPDPMGLGD